MWLISDAPRPDASEPRRIGSLSYALAALPRGPILPPASMTAEEAEGQGAPATPEYESCGPHGRFLSPPSSQREWENLSALPARLSR